MSSDPSEDSLASHRSTAAVGHRHVVRHRLPDGSATDTIGFLDAVGPDALTLTTRPGAARSIAVGAVIALRRVPDAPGGPGPLRTTPAELEQISAPGWVDAYERLGDWWLRSGAGFTGRANSALAVGDPGLPLEAAAAVVVEHADRHQIDPTAQVVRGSDEEAALTGLGWRATYVDTDVLVHRLGALLEGRDVDTRVTVGSELSPEWLAAFAGYRPLGTDGPVAARILQGRDSQVGLGLARDEDGAVVAVGRAHVNAGWTGVSALWTRPDHRRRGLATAVLTTLGRWSARRGARNVYLQVARSNSPAQQAYTAMGFRHHHGYRYLAPPR